MHRGPGGPLRQGVESFMLKVIISYLNIHLQWQALRITQDSCPLGFTSWSDPLLLSVGRTCDSLLTNVQDARISGFGITCM